MAIVLVAHAASAQTACEFQKLGFDGDGGWFGPGSSVDIDDERAVVGGEGRASVFELRPAGWARVAELAAGQPSNWFGVATAIHGDTVIVGAPQDGTQGARAGAVFVFERQAGQWVETAVLFPSHPGPDRGFGSRLAFDGEVLVVGAPGYSLTPGSAHVFERSSGGPFVETAWLFVAGGFHDTDLGASVALHGDTVVVGDPGYGAQVVHVYERAPSDGRWMETAALTEAVLDDEDRYGASVAVWGDTLAVGAPWHDWLAGAVFVYERDGSGWAFHRKLFQGNLAYDRELGCSVALEGDVLLAGARGLDDGWGWGDDAYVFRRNPISGNWPDEAYAILSGDQGDDDFGHSVALSRGRGIIGAPHDRDAGGTFVGAAYVTCLSEVGERVCSVGMVRDLRITGSQVAADDELILTVRRAWGRGYFLMGNGTAIVDPPGPKYLCLAGGPSGVLRIDQPMYDPYHRMELAVDLGAVRGLPGTVLAGQTWRFQAWWYEHYADQGAFSNAVSVTFQ